MARIPRGRSALLGMALGLLPCAAGPAGAGPLTSATLEIQLPPMQFEPPVVFSAAGARGRAVGTTHATLAAGSAFAGRLTPQGPITAAPPISGWFFVVGGNAAGRFTGSPRGALRGPMLVTGMLSVSIFGLTVPLVPLVMGAPGTLLFGVPLAGLHVTALATSWTAGSAAVTLSTPTSGGATRVRAAGSNALTPGGAGTLVLVTPLRIRTNLTGLVPVFGILTLSYVPEPGSALLLCGGTLALALLGRRRAPRGRPRALVRAAAERSGVPGVPRELAPGAS